MKTILLNCGSRWALGDGDVGVDGDDGDDGDGGDGDGGDGDDGDDDDGGDVEASSGV